MTDEDDEYYERDKESFNNMDRYKINCLELLNSDLQVDGRNFGRLCTDFELMYEDEKRIELRQYWKHWDKHLHVRIFLTECEYNEFKPEAAYDKRGRPYFKVRYEKDPAKFGVVEERDAFGKKIIVTTMAEPNSRRPKRKLIPEGEEMGKEARRMLYVLEVEVYVEEINEWEEEEDRSDLAVKLLLYYDEGALYTPPACLDHFPMELRGVQRENPSTRTNGRLVGGGTLFSIYEAVAQMMRNDIVKRLESEYMHYRNHIRLNEMAVWKPNYFRTSAGRDSYRNTEIVHYDNDKFYTNGREREVKIVEGTGGENEMLHILDFPNGLRDTLWWQVRNEDEWPIETWYTLPCDGNYATNIMLGHLLEAELRTVDDEAHVWWGRLMESIELDECMGEKAVLVCSVGPVTFGFKVPDSWMDESKEAPNRSELFEFTVVTFCITWNRQCGWDQSKLGKEERERMMERERQYEETRERTRRELEPDRICRND